MISYYGSIKIWRILVLNLTNGILLELWSPLQEGSAPVNPALTEQALKLPRYKSVVPKWRPDKATLCKLYIFLELVWSDSVSGLMIAAIAAIAAIAIADKKIQLSLASDAESLQKRFFAATDRPEPKTSSLSEKQTFSSKWKPFFYSFGFKATKYKLPKRAVYWWRHWVFPFLRFLLWYRFVSFDAKLLVEKDVSMDGSLTSNCEFNNFKSYKLPGLSLRVRINVSVILWWVF